MTMCRNSNEVAIENWAKFSSGGRLKEEGYILPISVLPTLTKHLALRKDVFRMEDGTIIVQGDHSLALEAQNILPLGEKYSTHGIGWWPLMSILDRLRNF